MEVRTEERTNGPEELRFNNFRFVERGEQRTEITTSIWESKNKIPKILNFWMIPEIEAPRESRNGIGGIVLPPAL